MPQDVDAIGTAERNGEALSGIRSARSAPFGARRVEDAPKPYLEMFSLLKEVRSVPNALTRHTQ